jgi:uncharacterized protein YkuJ
MFTDNFKVCMDIAENINGARHMRIVGIDFSYISLNSGELIFTSNQKKYQVLGRPPIEWNKEHFIDIDETAKRLAMEILEQVGEYEREGEAIISTKEWLAEVEAFKLKKLEWRKRLWIDDIKMLEVERWADFLGIQENPIMQDFATYLNYHLDNDKEPANLPEKPHFRELLKSEIDAANKLADFLTNHSNDLLHEGAEWIPQWIACH